MGKQNYYVWNDKMNIDTISNFKYKVNMVSYLSAPSQGRG